MPTPTPDGVEIRASRLRLLHREEFFCAPGRRMTKEHDDFRPIEWLANGKVRFLDQTLLPADEAWIETDEYRVVADAIRRLQLRGAPLIGISAAYALALAARSIDEADVPAFHSRLRDAADELTATRPTAINLQWAIDRLLGLVANMTDINEIRDAIVADAKRIHDEDVRANRTMAEHGAALLEPDGAALTHCNAGALATGGYGTALGVLRTGREQGAVTQVYATETRPLLQGARLTVWELQRAGIPVTLIADTAAGSVMKRGLVNEVVVGADRIVANGDVANKIGTYQLAVLAHENDIPFYVAAPTTTIDLSIASGDDIPIEERSPEEVTGIKGAATAPSGTDAANPAFDVTPARYVAAIITEKGVARAPYEASISALFRDKVETRG